jgi:NTE family protein
MQPSGQARGARERGAHAAIAALEHAGRHMLLVGTAEDPEWNAIILTQADLILVVANADADPRLSEIEASISSELLSRRELVLLHEPGKEPSGTARWLHERTLARHHHLRRDDRAHMGRLARRLAGCSVGLVLGGGGARGFGHIGVMHAIAELGIPVDRVGGTSMGSIIGAQVALGWSWEDLYERTRHAFRRDPMALDNTLPIVSKITCGKFVHLLQGLVGEARAEDCWLPFFSVSCSLTDASVVTHKEGKLWQCLRASSALPGIGPPVIQVGRVSRRRRPPQQPAGQSQTTPSHTNLLPPAHTVIVYMCVSL